MVDGVWGGGAVEFSELQQLQLINFPATAKRERESE